MPARRCGPDAALFPVKRPIDSALSQGGNVGRDVASLDAGEIHIWHLGVRIKQERCEAHFTEIGPPGNFPKRRSIRARLVLAGGNDMARGTPPFCQPRAIEGIGRDCWPDHADDEEIPVLFILEAPIC